MKVLVIQQKMIGDVLASTVICENLKTHRPESEVHYLVNEHTVDVVLHNPHIDKLIIFKPRYSKNWGKFYGFLKTIRAENYDVVIDVYGKLESNIISLFSRAPLKISYGKWYTRWIYTHLFDYAVEPRTPMGLAIENRLLLLNPIVGNTENLKGFPKIKITEAEKSEALAFLEEKGIRSNEPLIMVSVTGSSDNKTYPAPYMANLLDAIVIGTNSVILFNYSPSKETEAREVYDLCDEKTQDRIRFDIKPGSLRFFLSVLNLCDAIIGNEGGTMNMAKALGIPTFSIFSPWISKKAWHTFRDNPRNKAVHLADFQPQLTENSNQDQLKKKSAALYNEFRPEYIRDQLLNFLKLETVSGQ